MLADELTCPLPIILGIYHSHDLYARYERWFWNPQTHPFPDGYLSLEVIERHFDAIYH